MTREQSKECETHHRQNSGITQSKKSKKALELFATLIVIYSAEVFALEFTNLVVTGDCGDRG